MSRWTGVVYFVLGQAGWFACVEGAARGHPGAGELLVVALIVLHLVISKRRLPEAKLVATVALIGAGWESVLVASGLLEYPPPDLTVGIVPLWIILLWCLFAAQFNTTYAWLKTRKWAGALLGAIAGPVSFHAGSAIGAVRFIHVLPATMAIAIGWAFLLPCIIVLSRRWDGVHW